MKPKMMIYERNQQTLTKNSHSYSAKEFVRLQPKMAFFGSENYLPVGLKKEINL